MSRLDSFIRRVLAQRDCLNAAAAMIDNLPGPILELGLGNGRTYDHLRECLPNREIFVFDRQVAAHPQCIPDEKHMIIGDIRTTLPGILDKIGADVPSAVTNFMTERGYRFDREQLSELGALLPEALLDDFSLAGTVDDVIEKLTAIGRLGINEAALWPFPIQGQSLEEPLEIISSEVIPAVRAGVK